ncbi:MAG: hypothetical protein M3121_00980 [Chloroflexota bacterium]|nr:hypothetical protein [Chloroflexota bacterium]
MVPFGTVQLWIVLPPPEDLVLTALDRGVTPVIRADIGPGQSRAVAVDALGDAAVVLVVRHRRDGTWDLDLAQCMKHNGRWTDAA